MSDSYFPDFDHSTRPSLHLTTAGARPPLFIPPNSPSAKTLLAGSHSLTHQTPSIASSLKRKRVCRSHYTESASTPQPIAPWKKTGSSIAQATVTYTPVAESPAAFVNTRYHIAGGLDTPIAAKLDAEEKHYEDMRELDYRPNRLALATRQGSAGYFPQTPANVMHKRARSSDQSGWGRAVANLVGGVAGKVLNFCWNGAFRGFQAGGGHAYTMNGGTPAFIEQSNWMGIGEKDDVFNKRYQGQNYHSLTPVPGQFPEEGFIDDYMSQPQAHRADQLSTPGPEGDKGWSTIRGNWVLVNNGDGNDESDRSPVPPVSKNPRLSYGQRPPASRALFTAPGSRPRLVPSQPSLVGSSGSNTKRPASFASPRASPGRSCGSRTDSHVPNSPGHRRSRSSMASSPRRATEVGSRHSFTTPSSPDVYKFEKKMRRKERKEDESIQRLNKQLRDMIKEGKEALGTTVEIEDNSDVDEGYAEGSEIMEANKW